MLSKHILKKKNPCDWAVDWKRRAYEKEQWRAMVDTAIECGVYCNATNFLTKWMTIRFKRWTPFNKNLLDV